MLETISVFLLTPVSFMLLIWELRAAPTAFVFGLTAPVGLVLGVALGLVKRDARLLYFFAPLIGSNVFLAVAVKFRGEAAGSPLLGWVLWSFLAIQFGAAAILIWRLRGARIAAVALSWFTCTYALYALTFGSAALIDSYP